MVSDVEVETLRQILKRIDLIPRGRRGRICQFDLLAVKRESQNRFDIRTYFRQNGSLAELYLLSSFYSASVISGYRDRLEIQDLQTLPHTLANS